MKRSSSEILRILQENREQIRQFGVRRLGLFGSSVRDESNPTSDLDFVVEFERKSFDAYMDLRAFLEELLNCDVDLVISEAIKPRLRDRILKEAIHAPGL